MLLRFTKMHGLGNDFAVIDLVTQHARISAEQVRRLADRHFGIGFDQMLIVEPPQNPEVDFRYRIFNADGSEVEQCGNGARCFARFVRDKKLTHKDRIRVETSSGVIELQLVGNKEVRVNMGVPMLEPAAIPFQADARQATYELDLERQALTLSAVSMGNPHAVLLVEDVDSAPVLELGPRLEHHPRFPQRCNVGFLQIINRREARLRVFERGVGETLACGTGACAALVAGRLRGLLDEEVTMQLPGGTLKLAWKGDNQPVIMTGPATRVYEGQIRL
ncbi:diaminopimelate epimerase [Aestuariirhabdus litorea]|uniref:Diaminopimelate epimerase n=1 Tax=Aestuariirhabdus litorea TaxID=2528527 RepID=A0A3P3VJR4_9GAMM|nr:diaminopimelate epimerase [Aestuariirhabdus litorea]RRJ82955.1 diaminopimelate epimerase [Aestuariirhabdus litorea]RWW93114.1 diaminopimelate epimerase [Endozoicomonadaceae bacterium GTF-13]